MKKQQSRQNKQTPKILIINFDKRWGGGQEYLLNLVDGLLTQSLEVGQLIAQNSTSEERFIKKFSNQNNYKAHTINRKSFIGFLNLFTVLKNYNIIHIHREHDLWVGVLAKLLFGSKLLFSIHIHPKKKNLLFYFVDKVICNSKYIRDLFLQTYKTKTNECDLIYPVVTIDETHLAEQLINLQGNPKLLMSGAYWKNQQDLIEVFELVNKKLPEAKLYFIAPSENKKLLEKLKILVKQTELENKIEFFSSKKRDDYLVFLQSIDIFVYSYTKEPFGMAVLEAALINKPIVAYKGGGVSEILENYEFGHLIEHGDKEEFANKVIECSKTKINTSDKLNKKLLNKFSLENFIENNLKAYYSLIEES